MFRWMTMAALTGALAAPAQAETLEGPVMQVIDGNNIVIAGMVIRLDGLAAPGVHEARGDDAAYIMEMIVHDSGGAFRCELSGERLWERHIAICYDQFGDDVAAQMVERCYARDCARYSGGRYELLENAASRSLPMPDYCEPE